MRLLSGSAFYSCAISFVVLQQKSSGEGFCWGGNVSSRVFFSILTMFYRTKNTAFVCCQNDRFSPGNKKISYENIFIHENYPLKLSKKLVNKLKNQLSFQQN